METKIGNCYIVSGLQYGDEGKGTTVDFLVK
jgi:adenylosuccinate synthase